ncbi:MAG: RNA polymerase sigma factor [Anaerolineales bacterium]
MTEDAEPTDAVLVARTLEGETEAFALLVERYRAVVSRVARRIVRVSQEADDVAQETFMRAYDALRSYDPARPLGPWLYRIATNLSLNRLKRRRLTTSLDGEGEQLPLVDGTTGPEARVLEAEARERVRREVAALPEHYRRVVELRHVHGMSYEEIAEALDVPLGTVKVWLFRARKRLRQRLEDLI